MTFFIVLDKYLASEVGSCSVCGLRTDKGSSAFILLTTQSLCSECICEMEPPRKDQNSYVAFKHDSLHLGLYSLGTYILLPKPCMLFFSLLSCNLKI